MVVAVVDTVIVAVVVVVVVAVVVVSVVVVVVMSLVEGYHTKTSMWGACVRQGAGRVNTQHNNNCLPLNR